MPYFKCTKKQNSLDGELAKAGRQILEEKIRLRFADQNFYRLERNFLDAVVAVGIPGISDGDRVVIDRDKLIPTIWPTGNETSAYSFFTAGSGGKKVLLTICFAIALHQTAAQAGLPVPSLLMIDTPLKNITPDINPEIVRNFYAYLYRLMSSDLRGRQIIIIDQMLVKPDEGRNFEFESRLMTRDNPNWPPLISYYKGP